MSSIGNLGIKSIEARKVAAVEWLEDSASHNAPLNAKRCRDVARLIEELMEQNRQLRGAAASTPPEGAARIKQLEWEEVCQARSREDPTLEVIGWEADSNLGFWYEIGMYGKEDVKWSLSVGDECISDHDTPEETMQAGQAHLEAKIAAVIETPSEQPMLVAP